MQEEVIWEVLNRVAFVVWFGAALLSVAFLVFSFREEGGPLRLLKTKWQGAAFAAFVSIAGLFYTSYRLFLG